jgi:hypothetical protein
MNFLKNSQTNWKYILIVLILTIIVGGTILVWIKTEKVSLIEFPEIKKSEKTKLKDKLGMVAYIKDGNVWIKKLPNGKAKQLTNNGDNQGPRWSPSGAWVAYLNKNYQLQIIKSSGNDKKVLNKGAKVEKFAWSPASDILFCY